MRRALLCSLPLACLLAAPALAADPTPERAASAEAALRDFMVNLFGPAVRVGDKPIHLQPNGDHYDASATLAPGQQITATVQEGDNGQWTFGNLRYPNPAHFTLDLASRTPDTPDTHVTYDLKAAEQDQSGTIDTSLATPSTTRQSVRALDIMTTNSDGSSSTSHLGQATGTTTFGAGQAAGTIDAQSETTGSDYTVTANVKLPTGESFDIRADADGLDAKTAIGALSREQAPRFVRAVVSAIANGNGAHGTGPDSPAHKAAIREMVRNVAGVAGSMSLDETATKLHGVANGFAFGLDRVRIAFDGSSADGALTLGMQLETDGLTLPPLASNPLATFIPGKFTIHPVVSGLNTHDLLGAMDAALDPNRPDDAGPPPEFMALLAAPGLAAEIAAMEVDFGPSVITGTGKVTSPQPGHPVGAGRLTATQFDALTDRVKAVPEAAQALPVLLFAKGIARTEGDHLVWDISYDRDKALVNGVDVLALAAGAGAAPTAPAPAAPAAPPNRNGAGRNNRR